MYDPNGNMIIAKTKGVAGSCVVSGRQLTPVSLHTDDTTALMLQGPKAPALKVSPNPTGGILTIDYFINEDQQAGLQLTDVSGRIISVLNMQQHRQGYYRVQYDMGPLPAQTYFLTMLLPKNKKISAKVVKQ